MFFRVQVYHWAQDKLDILVQACRAVHTGFWLGLLDGKALDQATKAAYQGWSKYIDREYNQSGLLDWEKACIDKFFPTIGRILIGAAGGGREVLALLKAGFRVTAFDPVPDLVEFCKELLTVENLVGEVHLALPGDIPPLESAYDAAIIGWGGYMHIPGRQARIRFLRRYREHLADGAPILLSFFSRQLESRYHRWVYNIARLIRALRRSQHPLEVGDTLDKSYDHYFIRDEIEAELSASGFDLVHYAAEPYGHAVGVLQTRDIPIIREAQ